MSELRRFLRANPQALVLLLVCLILGIGTFLAVVFGLVSAGGGNVSGEPSGVVAIHPARASDRAPARSAVAASSCARCHGAAAPIVTLESVAITDARGRSPRARPQLSVAASVRR